MVFHVVTDVANGTKIHTAVCHWAQERSKLAKNGRWEENLPSYQDAYRYAMKNKGREEKVNCKICHPENYR
ncbi:hypothetical protein KSD_03760 [Ktedonobacter sp. SOSP1-85]|uniref:hypothetical protein n=1 Tax=Ktedonobacter sp. SOSP1-85 TaxID=2778367 RepID=UPI0019150836|nr:hypothetical protein [Ktedonobacter sp. SOSP1-85]GHO72605.1 hypothetical protein KSD_03760 [Ktedonobacter sp. SOSP1-85]